MWAPILKPGGRLGFISSSTFFKTGSGAPLRDFLRTKALLETVVDFGDHQIFEGVTTYPAILTMKAGAPPPGHELQFWKIGEMPADSFADAFADAARPFPQEALGRGSWELEDDALRALRTKITTGKQTLKEIYGSPLYGIKTGCNAAFVINQATRDQLIAEDPQAKAIIGHLKTGDDLERWMTESQDAYLICAYQGVDINRFPSILKHLEKFHESLELKPSGWKPSTPQEKWKGRKSGSYKWYELQDTVSYHIKFKSPKIVYPEFSQGRKFSIDESGSYLNNKAFFFDKADWHFLALLNSSVTWFILGGLSAAQRGGEWRLELRRQYIELIAIPSATDAQKSELGALAKAAQTTAEQRYALQQAITRRIPDLAADPANAKLTGKLKEWWNLPDFAAFQKEVEKVLKAKIPLQERNEWENWITTSRAEIHALTAEIARLETEINAKVYALFDLTPDEISLLEANV